ncbi:hypothetical protein KBX06_20085 [Micromonospora sp. C31]|nr:hypothetical protein [Micromonospora sp. C31]MBQ1075447.1 hypothetical protein [Micromonospora sp. C31]
MRKTTTLALIAAAVIALGSVTGASSISSISAAPKTAPNTAVQFWVGPG